MTKDEGTSAAKAQTVPNPDDPRKPEHPGKLKPVSWKFTATSAFNEFLRDECTDLAAALTYYSVLSIFPAIVALVSLFGIFNQGEKSVQQALSLMATLLPAGTLDTLRDPIEELARSQASGLALVVGLAAAIWAASGYVGAFGRAMNRIYQVDEGRPMWKLYLRQVVLTIIILALVAVALVALVVSGPMTRIVGNLLGLGTFAQTVWSVVKWPLLLAVVVVVVALLYYATPNVRQPKFRWISVGAVFAIVTWIIASLLLGLYVSNFSSYNRTYGSLAGIIIFLLWLWVTNTVLLLGAEIDSEMERARELQAGLPAEEELQLPPRETSASEKASVAREKHLAKARAIRESHADNREGGDGASDDRWSDDRPHEE